MRNQTYFEQETDPAHRMCQTDRPEVAIVGLEALT